MSISLAAATPAFCATTAQGVNIDANLQRLYAQAAKTMPSASATGVHSQIAAISPAMQKSVPGRFDKSGRVLIHVELDGTSPLTSVSQQVTALTGVVLDTSTSYRHGIIAAYLPADQIENCSAIAGVRALTMEYPPKTRVGTYTSQGASVLGTDAVNASGINGDGITVGVISDSFNTSTAPATTASQDVASGDLPVVNVLQDFPGGTDEGRAMCQIVYDEAPHCNLAFATADESEVGFANNIIMLRTTAHADVIVDDVGYLDEPVFSDGMVALSVDTVSTSKSLPGAPSTYCSSAGNDGNNGYRGTYSNLTDTFVRQTGNHGNLKLSSVPKSLTAGGWYNWNTVGGSEPFTNVSAPGPTTYGYAIFLQWDDLFDQDHGITTSYNFLVFDGAGNYQASLSSTTNAFAVQQPLQGIGYLALGTNYQIAITASTQTDPKAGAVPAAHHIALYTTLDGASTLYGKYFSPAPLGVPNMYGHPQADGAIAVAAYVFSWNPSPYLPELENFTSPGPATIYFDANDNRLTTPIVRAKPEVAGVDGVVNTFFGAPYYNNPFAFFGTSAAAPSVAGVAALMIQAAGGSGSLDPTTVKTALEESPAERNGVVQTTQALAANAAGYVSVTAVGQSYFNNYFTVNYTGPAGHSLSQLTVNGAPAGLIFDPTSFTVGTVNGIKASAIKIQSSTTTPGSFTLIFKAGSFTPGASFSFSISQDVAGTFTGYTQNEFGAGTESEDLAYGATFAARFTSKSDPYLTAPFAFEYQTTGYSPVDGYGLVNAGVAVGLVTPTSSSVKQ